MLCESDVLWCITSSSCPGSVNRLGVRMRVSERGCVI